MSVGVGQKRTEEMIFVFFNMYCLLECISIILLSKNKRDRSSMSFDVEKMEIEELPNYQVTDIKRMNQKKMYITKKKIYNSIHYHSFQYLFNRKKKGIIIE